MLGLALFFTIAINILSVLVWLLFDIDETYDGFKILTFINALGLTWFMWLVLEAGVTIEVIVK